MFREMKEDRGSLFRVRTVALFMSAAVVASLFMEQGAGSARAADQAPARRGQPIKPLSPKPAEAPTNTASPAVAVAGGTTNGFALLGFDTLSTFKYEVPEDTQGGSTNAPAASAPNPDDQIPANVKNFNGRRVALKGFMLPLKVEGGLVTELLLMRDQSMCCYGTVPKINEWVAVKMTSSGIKPVMDQAVTMYGTIKIGAMRENGYLVGIYQMDGERMDQAALLQ